MTQTNTINKNHTLNSFLTKTFFIVGFGIAISAIFAYIASIFVPYLIIINPGLYSIISLLSIVIELGIAFYFSLRLNRMTKLTAWICYFAYAILTGLSFSTILMSYANVTVTMAFVSTSMMFICMAIIGNTSNFDFTKAYIFLLPALIAGSIVTLINIFIGSGMLEMMVVYIGLILFLLITAADIQRLKDYYSSQYNNDISEKFMIMAAFQLYLDFANLFIKILQIFGRRKRND